MVGTALAGAAATVTMDAIGQLIENLRPGSKQIRRAVSALVQFGPLAVQPLILALKAGPWQVQQQAAKALGRIGDVRAVEPLIAALGHGRLQVRQQAARALGRLSDPRAVVPLIGRLNDRSADVRGEVSAALVAIGAPSVLPLVAVLEQKSARRVRVEAARTLGEMALAKPVPELRAALPLLNRLARSLWTTRQTRDVYLTALDQIEKRTAFLKDVPLPSTSPQPSPVSLPLPADAPPAPVPDSLPIPAVSVVSMSAATQAGLFRSVVHWWRSRTGRRR